MDIALIDFRDLPTGRQAQVQGSTLAVWEVVMVAEDSTDLTPSFETPPPAAINTEFGTVFCRSVAREDVFALIFGKNYVIASGFDVPPVALAKQRAITDEPATAETNGRRSAYTPERRGGAWGR